MQNAADRITRSRSLSDLPAAPLSDTMETVDTRRHLNNAHHLTAPFPPPNHRATGAESGTKWHISEPPRGHLAWLVKVHMNIYSTRSAILGRHRQRAARLCLRVVFCCCLYFPTVICKHTAAGGLNSINRMFTHINYVSCVGLQSNVFFFCGCVCCFAFGVGG